MEDKEFNDLIREIKSGSNIEICLDFQNLKKVTDHQFNKLCEILHNNQNIKNIEVDYGIYKIPKDQFYVEKLTKAIISCKNIEILTLESSNSDEEIPILMIENLGKFKNLKSLDICNLFNDKNAVIALSKIIPKLESLKIFQFWCHGTDNYEIENDATLALFNSLTKLNSLTELKIENLNTEIFGSMIEDSNGNYIPRSERNDSKILFERELLGVIKNIIKSNRSLQKLNLVGNGINDEYLIEILESVDESSHLKEFNVAEDSILKYSDNISNSEKGFNKIAELIESKNIVSFIDLGEIDNSDSEDESVEKIEIFAGKLNPILKKNKETHKIVDHIESMIIDGKIDPNRVLQIPCKFFQKIDNEILDKVKKILESRYPGKNIYDDVKSIIDRSWMKRLAISRLSNFPIKANPSSTENLYRDRLPETVLENIGKHLGENVNLTSENVVDQYLDMNEYDKTYANKADSNLTDSNLTDSHLTDSHTSSIEKERSNRRSRSEYEGNSKEDRKINDTKSKRRR